MLPDNDASYTVHGMVLVHRTWKHLNRSWLATCLCGFVAYDYVATEDAARNDWREHVSKSR